MLAVGLVAVAVSIASAYLFLARRGLLRWVSLAVFALTPLAVIVVYAFYALLWVAAVSAACWLLAAATARLALAGDREDWRMPEHPVPRPAARPFLIMNPKSGGGKVARFDLQPKAAALGAEVFLMSGPEQVDVAAVARAAVASGADLLGVAGGDGTQALVAEVAAEHGLPFVVITAGTRNHFALDLGLDRDDPAACLAALSDGVDLRVDLGVIGGQVFVNNASFGAYAEIVETPAYRGDKLGTTLDVLPSLLQGHRGARLAALADDAEITAPQALLISNNRYGSADIAGLNRRVRLDGGVLGVVGGDREQRQRGRPAAARQPFRRPDRADREGGDRDRRHAADPGRRRRRGGVAADAGGVRHPPRRAAGAGAARPARRHPGRAAGELRPAPAARVLAVLAGRRGRMTGAYERVTSLAELFARVGELAIKTLVFDIEPLVSPWNGGQQGLDRGVAEVLDQAGAVPSVRAVVFSTNSARRPSVFPPAPPAPARPAGRVPGLGGQAAADRAVSRLPPAGGGDRRPAPDRRDTRVPPRLSVPALRPALRRRAARAAAHAPLGPGRPSGPVQTPGTAVETSYGTEAGTDGLGEFSGAGAAFLSRKAMASRNSSSAIPPRM